MSKKEAWWKGWYLIPIFLIAAFAAWKLYPYVKAGTILKKIMGKG
jgi:hypothetical protein